MSQIPHINTPEPGYYWTRLIKGGPKVPVRIWRGITPDPWFPGNSQDRSPRLQCRVGDLEMPAEIKGRWMDVYDIWIWCSNKRIERQEYEYLLTAGRWDAEHDPGSPQGQPLTAIDINKIRPVF